MFLAGGGADVRLNLVAHPGSRVERVRVSAEDPNEMWLEVWVHAKPVEGKANAAIERAIAAALRLRPGQVRIVGGGTSRRKIVELDLPEHSDLRSRLMAYGLLPDAKA